MTNWAILTGEYPPDPGGVSDYTRVIARGLAEAGDVVRVYAPPFRGTIPDVPGLFSYRLPGRFGPRTLHALEDLFMRAPPDRILVQYVPHSFGYKAMNVPFATWIAVRAHRIAPVWAMFHEVAFPFSWRPATHLMLAGVTRLMARLIADVAERLFVTIPAWGALLNRLCPRAEPAEWLPVPCTIDANPLPDAVALAKSRFGIVDGSLVGHFGTFGRNIATLLEPAISELLRLSPQVRVLLIGRGSLEFRDRFIGMNPGFAGRTFSVGALPDREVSAYLRACDLLLQPYPDGISSRRTSAMAGLANGLPIVTNLGPLSESLWTEGGVAVVPTSDPIGAGRLTSQLLTELADRIELGRRALALYREHFAVEHTIAKLRSIP
jgi:glycosyltransferase involved in cell wall biosynthesis